MVCSRKFPGGTQLQFFYCWLLASDSHNFFVQTPFQAFLDSMESPLSQDFIHIPVEDSERS